MQENSKISANPFILICDCSSAEHQIIIRYEEEDNLFYAHIHLSKLSFFKRLISGIKYIFGYSCRYGNFEEFIFKHEHAEDLRKMSNLLLAK